MAKPERKSLPHDPPPWVDPNSEEWFVTTCCEPRGYNHLAKQDVWEPLLESVVTRNHRHVWYCSLFMAMPDHVHFLVTFPRERHMVRVMSAWKHWTAHCAGIHWQRGFFDRRLRSTESGMQKFEYVWNNPVRAGLVEDTAQWPFKWQDVSVFD